MSEQRNLPAAPPAVPGLPVNSTFFDFEGWEGIDTKPSRAGIDDNHCYWCDNIMPLGRSNARAMYDRGPSLYTATGGKTITWDTFFTLTNTGSQAIVFLSDGSAIQVAVPSGIIVSIAAAGTFTSDAGTLPYAFQYGPKYLIIISEQDNGYWLWDGNFLYGAGTIAPEINITSGGQGYTTAPTVTLLTHGFGTGATLHAVINAGSVTDVIVDNPGTGFRLNESPILVFNGGGGGDTAYGDVGIADGVITSVHLDDGGHGYTTVPTVTVTDMTGPGTGAVVSISGASGGILTGLTIVDGGHDYETPVIGFSGGGGSGAAASAFISNGVINAVVMTSMGSLYSGVPTVKFISNTAAPGTGAAGIAIVGPGGTITGVNITSGGSGYSGSVYVTFTGGQGPASADVSIMPFGVRGSSGDENNDRVWIASIKPPIKVVFSAPGTQSPQDFSVANGAGAFPPTDSHLQYQWTALKSSAGEFLYLLGDSSVDVESGANTSGTGTSVTTTFSKVNVDEQVGTIWRDSVINYGRAIVFANSFGIHTIYGGSVSKISSPLDGIYSSTEVGGYLPSSAVAEINGVHVCLVAKPIIDPVTGSPRNALFIWDSKRWWTASQSTNITLLSSREYASKLEAWGTDGTSLFQLFTTPSTSLPKTLLTKLWVKPTIAMLKRAMYFYALFETDVDTTLTFSIDTENGTSLITQGSFSAAGGGPTLNWRRSKTPDAAGHAIGYRMTSTSADFRLVDLSLLGQDYRLET